MEDIVIEFISQGRFVKVSAVDMATGIEATLVGDPAAGKEELKRLAVQKLKYVLARKAKAGQGGSGNSGPGVVI